MNRQDAVWITGVGTANPLGYSYETVADKLLAGTSGIRKVTAFSQPDHLSQIAGFLDPIPTPPGWDTAEFVRLEPVEQLLLWSCVQALQSAGLWERRTEMRIGLALGLGAGLLCVWEADALRGGRRMQEPEPDPESFLEIVQRKLQLVGPAATCAAACASANYALSQARRWVEMGWVDVCLTGGAEMGVTPVSMASFGNLRALSRRNSDPEGASRPFDRDRDGFVVGEGGAVFVLEAARAARRRGARAYAEVAGFGASSDAFHMVIPSADPAPAVSAVRQALADAHVNPDEIDYVNAHATSTPAGDSAETRVLRTVLGEAARTVPVSSTKSMTGHLLSGAAAMNALACLVALEHQAVPPTINLDEPDPECDLCHVPREARPQSVRVVVSNSLGFGGSNTSLVLRKVA